VTAHFRWDRHPACHFPNSDLAFLCNDGQDARPADKAPIPPNHALRQISFLAIALQTALPETEFYDLSEKLTAPPDSPSANAREIAGSSKPV
jgi:hypothetical protein